MTIPVISEFEGALWKKIKERAVNNVIWLDIQTDDQGQLVIYTGLAETPEGEIVDFDPDASEGTYKVG